MEIVKMLLILSMRPNVLKFIMQLISVLRALNAAALYFTIHTKGYLVDIEISWEIAYQRASSNAFGVVVVVDCSHDSLSNVKMDIQVKYNQMFTVLNASSRTLHTIETMHACVLWVFSSSAASHVLCLASLFQVKSIVDLILYV